MTITLVGCPGIPVCISKHENGKLYGMELSAEMVSKITDRILPEVREWQSRPLNPVYPFDVLASPL